MQSVLEFQLEPHSVDDLEELINLFGMYNPYGMYMDVLRVFRDFAMVPRTLVIDAGYGQRQLLFKFR